MTCKHHCLTRNEPLGSQISTPGAAVILIGNHGKNGSEKRMKQINFVLNTDGIDRSISTEIRIDFCHSL